MTSKILILEHRVHTDISDTLLKGAVTSIAQQGVECNIISVPKLYDLPVVIRYTLRSMELRVNDNRYMGYILLGCTPFSDDPSENYDIKDIITDIERLKLRFSIAVGIGIINHKSKDKALKEAADIGRNAALDCFKLLAIKRSLGL